MKKIRLWIINKLLTKDEGYVLSEAVFDRKRKLTNCLYYDRLCDQFNTKKYIDLLDSLQPMFKNKDWSDN